MDKELNQYLAADISGAPVLVSEETVQELALLREDVAAWREIANINFHTIKVAIARAEKAEATIVRVRDLAEVWWNEADDMYPREAHAVRVCVDELHAALKGETEAQ